MADGRGLPLLSGPLPASLEDTQPEACRKCNKEFNVIFTRPRKCNHCGYSYCHNCSDFQALMPRSGQDTGYDAMNVCAFCIEYLTITAAGRTYLKSLTLAKLKRYVTAYNIKIDRAVEKDDLIDGIISARRGNGCLPPENENYYRKYSVPNKITSRPRGLFSRPGQSSGEPTPPPRPPTIPVQDFPRPDLAPDGPPLRQTNPFDGPPPPPPRPQQQYNLPPHPPPRPHSTYPGGPQHQYPPPPPQFHTPPPGPPPQNTGPHGQGYQPGYNPHYHNNPFHSAGSGPPPMPSHASRPQPQQDSQQGYPYRPRTAPGSSRNTRPAPSSSETPPPPPPPPPPRPREERPVPALPPTLDELLTMPPERIGALSIGNLKSILNTNHVNPGQVLEKSDLVQKVLTLVGAEKDERGRQRLAEEMEEAERVQREFDRMEEEARARERRERESHGAGSSPPRRNWSSGSPDRHSRQETPESDSSPPPRTPSPMPTMAQKMASALERTGLCVVCQDDEANIAIVDCGHLAMCRGCSDMVMASSRECPLCRTRIVTEQRLLRIYKT